MLKLTGKKISTRRNLSYRVCTKEIIRLFLNQSICCGYSKEPWWDDSFEHPKHMLKLTGKKIFIILRSTIVWLLFSDTDTNTILLQKMKEVNFVDPSDSQFYFIGQEGTASRDIQLFNGNSMTKVVNIFMPHPHTHTWGSSNKEWDFYYRALNYHARNMKSHSKLPNLFGCSHVPYSTCYIVPIFVAT